MHLVILLSLLSVTIGQNSENVPIGELPDVEYFPSNETAEQNSQAAEENDQIVTTAMIPDTTVAEEVEASVEVFDGSDDTCGRPIIISNTKTDKERRANYEVGTELTYSCEFGYSTNGANHISQCVVLSEGDKPTWTDPEITCIPRSCGDPGFVVNARRIGSRFTFPNQVSFECDDGYVLKGSAGIRYCQASGRWSGSLPSCEKIFCDQPLHPENGRVFFNSLEYGSQLKYECETGFLLRNHHVRVCSENGTWSGPDPLCLDAQCDAPNAPEHGTVELLGGNSRVGSIAIYKCEDGKLLVGSATSKCLDIGEWTFPTPKCVEPCIVPKLNHGRIGRYEEKRYRRQKVYTQLSEGASIKEGEELYLQCDAYYEPLGRNKPEEKVICEKGEWLEKPICEPAKCRSEPPEMQNGKAATINRMHGGYVVYYCANGFKKTKYGNTTCHFGTWLGVPPVCSDTRCYVDRIRFPGVKRGTKNVYYHRQVFKFECESGYDVSESKKELVCYEGTWTGSFPPCKAASCVTSPPPIQHGRIKNYSELHSTFVTYECERDYFLQTSSGVQCLFGKWEGTPPICKESRCYFQNLNLRKGLITPSKDPINNGETIEVKCAAGYSVIPSIKPLCSNGQWTEYGTSPCRQNNCAVEEIRNGVFKQSIAKRVWRWSGWVTEYHLYPVKVGTTKFVNERLIVSCQHPYTFQGGNLYDVQVACTEGRWRPDPVCLPLGTYYGERRETESIAARTGNLAKITSTTPPNKQPATINVAIDVLSTKAPISEQKETEECYCLYEGPGDLVAYTGHELLKAGSRVKANASVKFYCAHYGYHRFMGSPEITCQNCKPWHSSEYPSCIMPVRGDVIIQVDASQKILPGGILSIDQGIDVQFNCISNGISQYPQWVSTAHEQSISQEGKDQFNSQDRFFNTLVIHNASSKHNGQYKCSVPGKRERAIQLCIRTKCQKFEESDEFHIHYDNKQEVNSSVLFTCKNPDFKLEGPNLLTCLSKGQWSGQPPRCVPKGCPPLVETDAIHIVYSSEDRAKGSTAAFHCSLPRVRNGNSFVNCLPNGEWSGDVPSCTLPRCPLEKLYEHIQENVVPNMENVPGETVPHGFELPLTCEGDLRIMEPSVAICGNNGDWEVPKVSCVPGCAPIPVPPDSSLIVDPKSDFYRFGEYVSLNCNPGQVLSAEVEILMCLKNGWSDSVIPTCIDSSSLTGK